jgi:hypothetical protein
VHLATGTFCFSNSRRKQKCFRNVAWYFVLQPQT